MKSATPILFLTLTLNVWAENWPQGPGPNYDFNSEDTNASESWSASLDQNVAWRTTLPETGQSTPTIWGDMLFVTTMKPVEADAEVGKDIVLWCLSAKDGSIKWQREIQGGYNTKLSGPFGDASAPAPVTDGKTVWALNPTGRIASFDMKGTPGWDRKVTAVSRTQPVLFEGKLIFHRQVYLPNETGKFTHDNAKAGKESWTQLQAIDAATGTQVWVSECGVNMGCQPLIQKLNDGTAVMVVGRGGGHGPPEKPHGISMIRAKDGTTMWTLELENFMSTQTFPVVDDQALVFHKGDHLWVDKSGNITRKISFVEDVSVRRWFPEGRKTVKETLGGKKPRSITQQSNLRVGGYHFFRAYTKNYLGRIHLKTGKVEYLELPLQVLREKDKEEKILWNASQLKADELAGGKKGKGLTQTSLRPNSVTNSRGLKVMGDARATANGWGHTASPIASAFGNRLHVPILSGIVFVIKADADVLDENAVIAINDLGELGEAFSRASISTDGKRIYAHTIKEVLAFE